MAKQQNIYHLPRGEIQVFDGDPLHYHAFMRAFDRNIEERADAGDCTSWHNIQGDILMADIDHVSPGARASWKLWPAKVYLVA